MQQQVATPNATSGGQFPKPSYNSGYGSTSYDTLNQTTQDYNKTPYASSGVGQQSKGQTVSNPQTGGTGSDITSSMYGKSHAALNKVNVSPWRSLAQFASLINFLPSFKQSYEKQSFHSGTPPPFNLVGSQTALNNVNVSSFLTASVQQLTFLILNRLHQLKLMGLSICIYQQLPHRIITWTCINHTRYVSALLILFFLTFPSLLNQFIIRFVKVTQRFFKIKLWRNHSHSLPPSHFSSLSFIYASHWNSSRTSSLLFSRIISFPN